MSKKDLVHQIEKMKGKVLFDSYVKDICNQIEKLTESLNQVTAANGKITSELVIVKNINVNLENWIVNLEKLQAKAEQYNRSNKVEISGILNEIPDEDLENNVIEICKNSNIIINQIDIEGYHRLSQGRNSTTDNKWVTVKFVNRKHSKLKLCSKKSISSKSKVSLCEKCPNSGVFSGPYFLLFRLNMEIYSVNLCIQSEYRKMPTRKSSIFGHFSRIVYISQSLCPYYLYI